MKFRLTGILSLACTCVMGAGSAVNIYIPPGSIVSVASIVTNGESGSAERRSAIRNECDCPEPAGPAILRYLSSDTLFDKRVDEIVRERDIEKKEFMYKGLLKEFPENSKSRKDGYLRVRASLALFWSTKGNAEKVSLYYDLIKGRVTTAHPLGLAINLVKHRKMEEAVRILYSIKQQVNDEASANAGRLYIFLRAYTTMAEALHYLKKDEEALTYIEQAYLKSDKKRESINTVYASILNSLGKHAAALPIFEDLVSSGTASDEIKGLLQESYLAVYGSRAGLTKLMDSLRARLQSDMSKMADTGMMALPAFDFTLTDLTGATVSLSSLRGKIVVLDFWATWCVPCIKSLPAMQKARDYFSSDPGIVFLFINTREDMPDRKNIVKEFMTKNGYDLHVLLDKKNSNNSGFVAASGFKVNGIPAKFIIDHNGIIRYRMAGFKGGEDATVAELIAMINNIKAKAVN